MPQVPGNPAEVDQIHDARNVVSATVSVLKSSVAIFRPTTSKVRVQKVLLCPFDFKTRPSGLSLASKGLQNITQVPGNPFEVRQNYDARTAVKVKGQGQLYLGRVAQSALGWYQKGPCVN